MHRLEIDLCVYEITQFADLVDVFEATASFDPGRLCELVTLRESLSHVSQHADFVSDFGRHMRHVLLLREGNDRRLQHGLVELVQLALLRVLYLLLDVKGQKSNSLIDVYRRLRLALRGELTTVHRHVRQTVMVQMHGARHIQAQLLLVKEALLEALRARASFGRVNHHRVSYRAILALPSRHIH